VKRVQKSVRGGLVSRTKLNELEDAINELAALHGSDGLLAVDGNGIKINLGQLIARIPRVRLHPLIYEVTSDEDEDGYVTAKPLNSDSTLVDAEETFLVMPE